MKYCFVTVNTIKELRRNFAYGLFNEIFQYSKTRHKCFSVLHFSRSKSFRIACTFRLADEMLAFSLYLAKCTRRFTFQGKTQFSRKVKAKDSSILFANTLDRKTLLLLQISNKQKNIKIASIMCYLSLDAQIIISRSLFPVADEFEKIINIPYIFLKFL